MWPEEILDTEKNKKTERKRGKKHDSLIINIICMNCTEHFNSEKLNVNMCIDMCNIYIYVSVSVCILYIYAWVGMCI